MCVLQVFGPSNQEKKLLSEVLNVLTDPVCPGPARHRCRRPGGGSAVGSLCEQAALLPESSDSAEVSVAAHFLHQVQQILTGA